MAQAAADSRWITVREAYDHIWPSRASTNYPPGEYRVKNEVADRAIAKGKATEGRVDGTEATPPKPKRKRKTTKAAKSAKVAGNAKAPDARPDAAVAVETVAPADSADIRGAVDSATG